MFKDERERMHFELMEKVFEFVLRREGRPNLFEEFEGAVLWVRKERKSMESEGIDAQVFLLICETCKKRKDRLSSRVDERN